METSSLLLMTKMSTYILHHQEKNMSALEATRVAHMWLTQNRPKSPNYGNYQPNSYQMVMNWLGKHGCHMSDHKIWSEWFFRTKRRKGVMETISKLVNDILTHRHFPICYPLNCTQGILQVIHQGSKQIIVLTQCSGSSMDSLGPVVVPFLHVPPPQGNCNN